MNHNIFAFSATECGSNHVKANKRCEDASDFYEDEKTRICVVADGHGSDNYPRTDRGAQYAVEAAINCIVEFTRKLENPNEVLNDEKNDFDILIQLAKSILNKWHEKVNADIVAHPFSLEELINVSDKYKRKYLSSKEEEKSPEKAYGSTLIVGVTTEDYSFGMQIGDGKCVAVDRNGTFSEPIPWDENCQLNVTTSICDIDAIDEFRFFVSAESPVAFFCGSDGVDDSYSNSEELHEFYNSVLKIFTDYGKDTGEKEVKEYLPILTRNGSGDDVSIAFIIDSGRLKSIREALDIQSDIFKANNRLSDAINRWKVACAAKEQILKNETLEDLSNIGEQIRKCEREKEEAERNVGSANEKYQNWMRKNNVQYQEDVYKENMPSNDIEQGGIEESFQFKDEKYGSKDEKSISYSPNEDSDKEIIENEGGEH